MARIFRKKKPVDKPVSDKPETPPPAREKPPEKTEAKKKIRLKRPQLGNWREFFGRVRPPRWRIPWWIRTMSWAEIPWWGRVFITLGMIGIGFAIWYAVSQHQAPPPASHLTVAASPAESGQVSVTPRLGDYPKGRLVTLEATPAPDYEFVSWSEGASGTEPVVTVKMNSDKDVTANFRIIRYVLTTSVSPAGGGSVTPGDTYDTGSPVALEAVPAPDYEFVSWSGAASGKEPAVIVTMNSDKDVTANFRIIRYVLTTSVSPAGGGSVSPGGLYDTDSPVVLEAVPAPDYKFVSWSGDVSGTEPVVTVTMDADKEVTANFAATVQEIVDIMPQGISGSAVVYTNELEAGEIIEGFVELTGEYYSQDWSFDWDFLLINPEGRNIDFWTGHWVKNNHHDFSFKAQYSGLYKIMVRHDSRHDKIVTIRVVPMGWAE